MTVSADGLATVDRVAGNGAGDDGLDACAATENRQVDRLKIRVSHGGVVLDIEIHRGSCATTIDEDRSCIPVERAILNTAVHDRIAVVGINLKSVFVDEAAEVENTIINRELAGIDRRIGGSLQLQQHTLLSVGVARNNRSSYQAVGGSAANIQRHRAAAVADMNLAGAVILNRVVLDCRSAALILQQDAVFKTLVTVAGDGRVGDGEAVNGVSVNSLLSGVG